MRSLMLSIALLMIGATATSKSANETVSARSWREGVHYTTVGATEWGAEKTGEVVEMFSYSCGACNAFEPKLLDWIVRKPKDIAFLRIPVTWGRYQKADARLFFTLRALHREDLHQTIYDTIHKDGKILSSPRDEEALLIQTQFAAAHGIPETAFLQARSSPEVNEAMVKAEDLVRRYRVTNTPTIVINGKYTTTMGQAGGSAELVALIDYLVALEHRKRTVTRNSNSAALRASSQTR